MTIAYLLQRPVALFHSFVEGLLLEGDLTYLLKILLAHLLLGSLKLCHIGVMALLHILVGTLENGVLLQCGDRLCLVNAAKAGGWVRHTPGKVHPTLHPTAVLAPLPPGIPADGDHVHEGVVEGGEGVGQVGEGLVL